MFSYLNVTAGSILLGFGFLHVLPDALESFSEFDDSVSHFPIIHILVLVGFFSVMSIEKFVVMKTRQSENQLSSHASNGEVEFYSRSDIQHNLLPEGRSSSR